jgi:hypothetical protein
MRLGVTGRDRTGVLGITTRGSTIELRPHPSALNTNGLDGRNRTADLMLPKHPRYLLRYTELKSKIHFGCALARATDNQEPWAEVEG